MFFSWMVLILNTVSAAINIATIVSGNYNGTNVFWACLGVFFAIVSVLQITVANRKQPGN